MSGKAAGPSLLQSIKSGAKKFKLDPSTAPRQVENAEDKTHDSNTENGLNAKDPQNGARRSGGCSTCPSDIQATKLEQQPAKQRPKSMGAKFFYKSSALRLEHVEERVLRFLAQIRDRAIAGGKVAILWRQFPTQQQAFDFADRENPSADLLRVFSVELASSGSRKFLVTSYPEFWRRYSSMVPQHRHYYEIIRQGWPCHMYLDLEYAVEDNPGKDGQAAVDSVLSLLREMLQERERIALQDNWILELDSSTEKKFSRHLIIRLPGAAFASNIHVGAFIQELCKVAQERRNVDPRRAALFVKKGESDEVCFIDTGVYTKNRAFRLYLSSKAGKTATLHPTERYACSALSTKEQFFMASLVCNVAPEARLLRCSNEINGPPTVAAARAAAAKPHSSGATSSGPSPYPALDTFIESVCSGPVGSQGSIRSWAVLDDGAVLLYNIKGSRYCGNINREHKSNGVYYIVDLQQGVWYQKCYDPECRHYRSPVTALPEEVIPERPEEEEESEEEEGGKGGFGNEERNLQPEVEVGGAVAAAAAPTMASAPAAAGQNATAIPQNGSNEDIWGESSDAEEWDAMALKALELVEKQLAQKQALTLL